MTTIAKKGYEYLKIVFITDKYIISATYLAKSLK